ncbi:hypothetical protein FRC10_005350 [Ceratobasidium sp. 414]|nr:hypothetical protein FRC10_005350 [Ceratobasidium sp. 414]
MDSPIAPFLPKNTALNPEKKRSAGMLWPLVLHCVASIGIACAVVYGANNHDFDTKGKSISVSFADAIKMHYSPSQSDVTTILSASITVLRTIAAAWSGPLCWRSAFLLLEKSGLERRDLKLLANIGPLTLLKCFIRPPLFYVSLLFLGTLPAQYAGPILTGSISWIPSTRSAGSVAEAALRVSTVSNSDLWDGYSNYTPRRRYISLQAAGYVNTAWGRNFELGVLKRVIPSADDIPVGSIIANVTLPYFSVTSLEWIKKPAQALAASQLDTYDSVPANLSTFGSDNPLLSGSGALALIQDSPWSEDSVTTEALRMMPDITASLNLLNTSTPTTWGNIDDYVIDVLGRSYSGGWTALTEYLGGSSPPLTSKFTPSVSSSRARVELWRVYLWLGFQFLAIISGMLFIMIQSQTKNRLVGDTTLAAFYLDTTAVPRHRSSKHEGLLKLQEGHGRLEVVLK